MKISFFSNFLTPHQLYFSNSIMKFDDVDYTFVANIPFNSGEVADSFEDMNKLPFVLETYKSRENEEKALELAADSDILICGSSDERYVKAALDNDVLVLRYSERILKKGTFHALSPRARFNVKKYHTDNMDKKMYMLCSSAYTAADFSRFGAYKRKTYKWGYFPQVKEYDDINALISRKETASIVWVGRFIDIKHPELVLKLALNLKKSGYDFKIKMLGDGPLFKKTKNKIIKYKLTDCIELLGVVSTEKVREYMEKSSIFIFTSDFREGWGVVLNEAMNSGCACVASHAIGSAPYLIKHKQNGLIFKNKSIKGLCENVRLLLDNPELQKQYGANAYETVSKLWNPSVAAERILTLITELSEHGCCDLYDDGPCSRADYLSNNWFKG